MTINKIWIIWYSTIDLIFDLFENYIDYTNKKEKNISFNNILRTIPRNVKKENIQLMDNENNKNLLLIYILLKKYLN